MWTVLGAAVTAAMTGLIALLKWIFGGRKAAEGVELGQAQQQESDAGAAAKSEAKVAQAEAKDAGLTDIEVNSRLNGGTF